MSLESGYVTRTINVDLDCIMVAFMEACLDFLNRDWKLFAPNPQVGWLMEHITTFKFDECLPGEVGKALQAEIHRRGFFWELKPLPGSITGLHQLWCMGHDLHLITAFSWGSESSCDEKLAWVKKWIPFIHPKKVSLSHQKHKFADPTDIVIEDSPGRIEKYAARGVTEIYSIEYPYNRDEIKKYGVKSTPYTDYDAFWPMVVKDIDFKTNLAIMKLNKDGNVIPR